MDTKTTGILSAPRQIPEGAIRTSRPPSGERVTAQPAKATQQKTATKKKPAEPLKPQVKQFLARKIGTHGNVLASLQDLSTTTHFDVVVNSSRLIFVHAIAMQQMYWKKQNLSNISHVMVTMSVKS